MRDRGTLEHQNRGVADAESRDDTRSAFLRFCGETRQLEPL
jgi:hypothetical protein